MTTSMNLYFNNFNASNNCYKWLLSFAYEKLLDAGDDVLLGT